jgi:hypothetical protein
MILLELKLSTIFYDILRSEVISNKLFLDIIRTVLMMSTVPLAQDQ